MADSAVSSYKAFGGSVSTHMARSSYKLPALGTSFSHPGSSALGASSSRSGASERIKCFYMIYDCWFKDPYSFTCFVLNKENGETTVWTISPAPDTEPLAVHLNYTAVALGSTIYMIGGSCRSGFCPDGFMGGFHLHAEVRYFNTLRPEDGWRHAAPMHIARGKPTAVVVDGMIYVLGGSSPEAPQDGECFDPNTNEWHRFSAVGCRACFASIQVPYIDPNGAKSILVHSDQNAGTLFAYILDSQKWEVVSHDFVKCSRPGAILDGVIYAVLDDEEQPLHGYHLIQKRWFTVELPEFGPGTEICTKTMWVFASGSDRLCLLWYHFDVDGRGKHSRMECLELRLDKSYSYSGDGMMLNLTASKVSHTYFRVQNSGYRKSILAL